MLESLTYQEYEKDCDTLLHLCKLSIITDEEYATIWNKITQYYIKERTNCNLHNPQTDQVLSLVI